MATREASGAMSASARLATALPKGPASSDMVSLWTTSMLDSCSTASDPLRVRMKSRLTRFMGVMPRTCSGGSSVEVYSSQLVGPAAARRSASDDRLAPPASAETLRPPPEAGPSVSSASDARGPPRRFAPPPPLPERTDAIEALDEVPRPSGAAPSADTLLVAPVPSPPRPPTPDGTLLPCGPLEAEGSSAIPGGGGTGGPMVPEQRGAGADELGTAPREGPTMRSAHTAVLASGEVWAMPVEARRPVRRDAPRMGESRTPSPAPKSGACSTPTASMSLVQGIPLLGSKPTTRPSASPTMTITLRSRRRLRSSRL